VVHDPDSGYVTSLLDGGDCEPHICGEAAADSDTGEKRYNRHTQDDSIAHHVSLL
jgi:hypothetical protein